MGTQNIVLIGMPASGKSTVGVILAKMLGYDFVDTDLLIQRQEQARLEKIIATQGTERFLDIECAVCCSLETSRTVIATGGSVIYREQAMQHFRDCGTLVYLHVGIDSLTNRLSDMRQRGVALKDAQSLHDLYNERRGLYEKYADVMVDEGALSLEETVSKVYESVAPLIRQ